MAIVSKGRSSMAIQRASPHRSWGSRFSSHARTSVILERQPFLRRCRFVVVVLIVVGFAFMVMRRRRSS